MPDGDLLVQFAEAAVEAGPGTPGGCRPDDPALAEARQALREALGPEALGDAAGVVGNFQRMDRIADATGIVLDPLAALLSADLRRELGIDAYAAPAEAPRPGALGRALGGMLRRVGAASLRRAARRRRGRE